MGEEGLEKLEKWAEVGKVVMDTGGQSYRVRTELVATHQWPGLADGCCPKASEEERLMRRG